MAEQHEGFDGLDGAELLRIARATLMQDLAPAVPSANRYELLMADNAMGIAARELEHGDASRRRAVERLEALYSDDAAGGELQSRLAALSGRLAADIRAGRFDEGEPHAEAYAALRANAIDAVRISNPRFLERRGIE